MTMPTRTRIRSIVAAVAVASALLAAGCGSDGGGSSSSPSAARLPGSGKPPITLGTKNFTEQFVLGQLYKQALEAKGFTVVLKQDVGASEIIDRALESGRIDMYMEYIGVIAQELARTGRHLKTRGETLRTATAFERGRGFELLEIAPGADSDANVVRLDYARRHHLKSTADLKGVGTFRYGGPAENRTRFQGAVGMRRVYGLTNLRYVPVAIDRRYQALDDGTIDVAAGFSTEGQLLDKAKYLVLTDPKGIFGFQNIAPVISGKLLARLGPQFTTTVNAVSAKLTDQALREMNAAVDLRGQQPADVAARFLQQSGLK
ncbi:MAG: osmoprotectant transport system substrate-binding protein [Thermoleophilaceae bacterium]|nr:osmoprotectant transport system substrate-binding protein [Thermoleophilaceae bacterium]